MRKLPIDQVRALVAWEKSHGRFWKSDLRQAWHTGRYGLFPEDHQAALQRLRNENIGWLSRQIPMTELKEQLHAYDVRVAVEALLKEVCPAGFPAPGYHARQQATELIGLLQLNPEHYDGTL